MRVQNFKKINNPYLKKSVEKSLLACLVKKQDSRLPTRFALIPSYFKKINFCHEYARGASLI